VTTMCAVLLGLMKTLTLPAAPFVCVAVYFAVIGMAQAVLFSGKDPRAASMVAGGALSALGFLALFGYYACSAMASMPGSGKPAMLLGGVAFFMVILTVVGAVLGDLAGLLVAWILGWSEDNQRAREDEEDRARAPLPEETTWLDKMK
jgi:hypothetical protein